MIDVTSIQSNWDVKTTDPIDYFDSGLSYELTGYRPINEEQGLDFDVSGFIETRQIKVDTGVYTSYRPGTKMYNDFWKEQYRRCREGYIYNNYRITGDNYFFLNFYRIQSMEVEVAGESRAIIFPNFFAKQYEYFHYIELCRYTGHDVCTLKSRGVGFSEIAAGIGINAYTTIRNSLVEYTAFDAKKLSDILSKCWSQMEFLNSDTEGGMKHLRMKYNSEFKKKASVVDKQGNESGFKSEVKGVIADTPSKLRGDRVNYLFFEEAGSDPILVKKYLQNKALVELGGKKIGIRVVWGTGR